MFERADVFEEWMTKLFKQITKPFIRMTKAVQMDANFSEQLTNRL